MRNTWIILQNIGFALSVGHQADHEFNGRSRAAYDGFAREHVRRKSDARMIHDGWLSDPVFGIDITRTWRRTRFPEPFEGHGVKRRDAFAFYAGDIRVEGPHPFCSSSVTLRNGRTHTTMYTDSIEGGAIVASKSASKMCARIGGGRTRLNPGYFPVTAFVSRFAAA